MLAPPVVAVPLVAWGAAVSLDRAGVVVRALAVGGLFASSCVLAATPGVALVCVAARRRRIGPAIGLALGGLTIPSETESVSRLARRRSGR